MIIGSITNIVLITEITGYPHLEDKNCFLPYYLTLCTVLSHSAVSDFLQPHELYAAHQASLSMGILQTRILEWIAIPASRGSSQPRD